MDFPDPKAFAQALIDEMKQHGHALWIDPETHAEQHTFIAEMIAERRERMERRKRLEEKIAGSIILSGLFFLIGLLGVGFMQWVRNPS